MRIKETNKGFTIIETFVAISVLLAAIAGPLVIISEGLSAAAFAKQKLIASALALEGIEVVRNMRDNNLLDPAEPLWTDGLTAGTPNCTSPTKCIVDAPDNILTVCTGDCDPVQQNVAADPVGGLYSHNESGNDWVETIYTREVTITPSGSDEIEIEVTVSWAAGVLGSTEEVVINEHLFNWF